MHFCIKCIFAQLNIFLWKMWCKNAFLHSQNAFCRFLTFCKQNVRAASNAFCRFLTFCKQNVRAASLFFAKQKTQHFCIKCIFASTKCYKCIWCQNAFWQRNAPAKCKGSIKQKNTKNKACKMQNKFFYFWFLSKLFLYIFVLENFNISLFYKNTAFFTKSKTNKFIIKKTSKSFFWISLVLAKTGLRFFFVFYKISTFCKTKCSPNFSKIKQKFYWLDLT